MWGLLAWLALLAATVALAGVAFHFDLTAIPAAFQALSPTQQIAAILIALVAMALIASTLHQAWRAAREAESARALREGVASAKGALAAAKASQKDFDAAVSHLSTSDPEDALSSI